MPRLRSSSAYNQLLITHIISKTIFIKYLPPVRPKMVPKLKMLRVFWNLAHVLFRISQSRFWCRKLFLLNTYHLFGLNSFQNWKYFEFIEIWYIWYFKYIDLYFNIKNNFYQIVFSNFNIYQISVKSEHFSFWDQFGPSNW